VDTYGIALKNSLDAKVYYDTGAASQTGRKLEAYDIDFSDPFGTPSQLFAAAVSMYATYSTSQFGWAFPVITQLRAFIAKLLGK
jgi:hypothetical protein